MPWSTPRWVASTGRLPRFSARTCTARRARPSDEWSISCRIRKAGFGWPSSTSAASWESALAASRWTGRCCISFRETKTSRSRSPSRGKSCSPLLSTRMPSAPESSWRPRRPPMLQAPTPRSDRQSHPAAPANPSLQSAGRGLDWFNLFVANIQTGFGPFIAVYLSGQSWTQTSIGLALSIGTVTSMLSQVPAGALVDAMKNKTRVAAFSVLVFTASALMFAIHPIRLFVYLAEILHGISSCTLGPAIAAMSLMLAGRFGMAVRLGRNARFAAVGNGVGAALMGGGGQYVSERGVFYLTAALTLPALAALLPLRRVAIARQDANSETAQQGAAPQQGASRGQFVKVLADRRLLIFCGC